MSHHHNDLLANLPPGGVVPQAAEHDLEPALVRLVGPRSASRLMKQAGAVGVARWNASELAATSGVSLTVAERVVAARELGDASTGSKPTTCNSSLDVRRMLPWLERFETEVILAIVLDGHMHAKATVLIAKGGGSAAAVHARDVFMPLVRLGASAFVLVHNHPSGNPSPSREDVEMTNKLAEAGQVLGITLIDHVVIASRGMVSFVETALMPTKSELEATIPTQPAN